MYFTITLFFLALSVFIAGLMVTSEQKNESLLKKPTR